MGRPRQEGQATALTIRDDPAIRAPVISDTRFMIPLGTEAWLAVFGGLIPILGLVAIGYIIIRAVRNDDDDNED